MNRWGKVIRAICEEAKEQGIDLKILEADTELNWFALKLEEVCSQGFLSKSDVELYKEIKGRVEESTTPGKYIAYVSPVNLQADIYESERKRFPSPGTSRPFAITRDGFRVGFFDSKEKAVDFFLNVGKRLKKEESLNFHLFY